MANTTWETGDIRKFPKLNENIECEVLIIGAGLAGVWSAYLLSKAGKRVVMIDSTKLGQGTTLYTTAFITQSIDTELTELIDIYGKRTARLAWEAGRDAIKQIEDVIHKEKIDCEFKKTSVYVYAADREEYEDLQAEETIARSFGFETELKQNTKLGFKNYGAWEIKNQAKYHPMKFYFGLLEACIKQGVVIYEKTEAEKFLPARSGARVMLKNSKIIKADQVIVSTYEAFNNPKPTHFKKAMYTSYVYELQIKKGLIPEGMYLDLHNPYHYFRIDTHQSTSDRMILGGEDHRAEIKLAKKSFKALEDYLKETFPGLKYTVVNKWDGGILEPSDGLPLIGSYAPNQYVATAFSGNGMTYAAISGVILRDLILGKQNKYAKMYDPTRKLSVKALYEKAKDYTGEFKGGVLKNLFK